MLDFRLSESRKAVLGPRAGTRAAMELTAAHRESSGALAWRAPTRSGLAPLAGPLGAKAPSNALIEVAFCHRKPTDFYGVLLYHNWCRIARCKWLGPRIA